MAAAAELRLLEKSLGLKPGNKYSAQGERQVPVLQTNNGPSLMGLSTIATHLVKEANKEHLLGSTAEEKALVQQWLEFRITRVDGHSSKEDTQTLLKDLNSYLEDKVYLAGHNTTLADILLYYGLHRFICHWDDFVALFLWSNCHRSFSTTHVASSGSVGWLPPQSLVTLVHNMVLHSTLTFTLSVPYVFPKLQEVNTSKCIDFKTKDSLILSLACTHTHTEMQ
uniref:Eukaryotic translation elongation factor 1 epsilon 1 n=1 Tax=Rattus norvegicus TaxID=10116 RepID=A0A8I6A4G8_RAT